MPRPLRGAADDEPAASLGEVEFQRQLRLRVGQVEQPDPQPGRALPRRRRPGASAGRADGSSWSGERGQPGPVAGRGPGRTACAGDGSAVTRARSLSSCAVRRRHRAGDGRVGQVQPATCGATGTAPGVPSPATRATWTSTGAARPVRT